MGKKKSKIIFNVTAEVKKLDSSVEKKVIDTFESIYQQTSAWVDELNSKLSNKVSIIEGEKVVITGVKIIPSKKDYIADMRSGGYPYTPQGIDIYYVVLDDEKKSKQSLWLEELGKLELEDYVTVKSPTKTITKSNNPKVSKNTPAKTEAKNPKPKSKKKK